MDSNNVVGSGQGLMRLLAFSAALASEKGDVSLLSVDACPFLLTFSQRLEFDHWDKIINDFFYPTANLKLTLWKDNDRREAKPFGT
jgi:LIM-domain binding protein